MKLNKKRLLHAMIEENLNNESLSQKSSVSKTRISNIRSGANCSYDTACKIAAALNIDVNELIEKEK